MRIYEQSTVLTTKTAMLCALCEFFASSRALARRRASASVRTLPGARIEPRTLPEARYVREGPPAQARRVAAQHHMSHVIPNHLRPSVRECSSRYNSHVCHPTAACSFYIRSHIFSQSTSSAHP